MVGAGAWWVGASILWLVATSVAAEPLGVGGRLEPFALEDQHGVEHRVDEATRVIAFSRDMDGGKLLRAAFADLEASALSQLSLVYVADISGMPKMVARLFALPSMRRRPYPMLLDREGETTAALPDVEGSATLIYLDALEIARVEHPESADAIRRLLGLDEEAPSGGD